MLLSCRFQWGGWSQCADVIGSGAPLLKGPLCWQRSARAFCFSCGSSHRRQHHEKDNTEIKVLRLTPTHFGRRENCPCGWLVPHRTEKTRRTGVGEKNGASGNSLEERCEVHAAVGLRWRCQCFYQEKASLTWATNANVVVKLFHTFFWTIVWIKEKELDHLFQLDVLGSKWKCWKFV